MTIVQWSANCDDDDGRFLPFQQINLLLESSCSSCAWDHSDNPVVGGDDLDLIFNDIPWPMAFYIKKNCVFAFLICTSRNAAQRICCRHIQLGMSWVGALLVCTFVSSCSPWSFSSKFHRSPQLHVQSVKEVLSSSLPRSLTDLCIGSALRNEEWAVVQTLVQIDYSDINKTSNGHQSFWSRESQKVSVLWRPGGFPPAESRFGLVIFRRHRFRRHLQSETTQQSVYHMLITISSLFRTTFQEPYILLNLSIGGLQRQTLWWHARTNLTCGNRLSGGESLLSEVVCASLERNAVWTWERWAWTVTTNWPLGNNEVEL